MDTDLITNRKGLFREFREILLERCAREHEYGAQLEAAREAATDLGDRLHAARHSAGLTRRELADRTGVSETWIGAMENGVPLPSQITDESLCMLAEALGLPYEELGVLLLREATSKAALAKQGEGVPKEMCLEETEILVDDPGAKSGEQLKQETEEQPPKLLESGSGLFLPQPTVEAEEDPFKRYLTELIDDANCLPEVRDSRFYDLADIYTALDATELESVRWREKLGRFLTGLECEETRRVPLQEMINSERHLVILGEPGAGKTTLLRHLAYTLAQARQASDPAPWLERVKPWDHGPVLPVRVELSTLVKETEGKEQGAAELVLDCLHQTLADRQLDDVWPLLAGAIRDEGRSLLILVDGLDEVPTDLRATVVEAIQDFVDRYQWHRYIVTCRPHAYTDRICRLRNFQEVMLAPFTEEQVDRYITNWCRVLARRGRFPAQDAEGYVGPLRRAMQQREIRELARHPLMLAIMTRLYTSRGQLPEHQTELYAAATDFLRRSRTEPFISFMNYLNPWKAGARRLNVTASSGVGKSSSLMDMPASKKSARVQRYRDVEIYIGQRLAEDYPVELTLEGQRHHSYFSVSELPGASNVYELGVLLYEMLTNHGPEAVWSKVRDRSSQCRIRLLIDEDASELLSLPWELMYNRGRMFSADVNTPFCRYFVTSRRRDDIVGESPIRMLAAISSPIDLDDKYQLSSIDVARERRILEESVAGCADAIRLEFLESPVTQERLKRKLHEGYHIVHFVGHGSPSGPEGDPMLYFESETKRTEPVAASQIIRMLRRQEMPLRLAVLSACRSSKSSTVDAFMGLAPRLVAAGLPAAIAMQEPIGTDIAREFSSVFYRRLAEHGTVDLAMNEARGTLLASRQRDWAIPVLYMRVPDGQLWGSKDKNLHSGGALESDQAPAPDSVRWDYHNLGGEAEVYTENHASEEGNGY